MQYEFNEVLKTYLLDNSRKTNKESRIHSLIINQLPESIRNNIVYDKSNYHIVGSYGQGNKSKYPWVMIANKSITKSAQKGLYLVYLFRSDMKGFYLSLNQGITFYKNNYGKESLKYASKVSNYFRSLISTQGYLNEINLVSKNNDLAKGYEASNIFAKYYEADTLNSITLSQDLNKLLDIYTQILNLWVYEKYEDVVENVINNIILPTKEGHVAVEELIKAVGEPKDGLVLTFELEKVAPPDARNNKRNIVRVMPISKKDYPKIQKENSETGYFGELKVFEYEQNLLKKLNIDKSVKWEALNDDTKGYDILSYEFSKDKIVEKFIEVKTTKGNEYSPFYISRNELDKFKSNSNYVIYRVFDANKKRNKARFYEIRSLDDKIYEVQPENFIIKIK